MASRIPTGPRFVPRDVPGGDPASYLEARFKGSDSINTWPCHAEVILYRPAQEIIPYARDGVVEALDFSRSRVRLGAWSWAGLASTLARWDAEIVVVSPAELTAAFADLADRAKRAAGGV